MTCSVFESDVITINEFYEKGFLQIKTPNMFGGINKVQNNAKNIKKVVYKK